MCRASKGTVHKKNFAVAAGRYAGLYRCPRLPLYFGVRCLERVHKMHAQRFLRVSPNCRVPRRRSSTIHNGGNNEKISDRRWSAGQPFQTRSETVKGGEINPRKDARLALTVNHLNLPRQRHSCSLNSSFQLAIHLDRRPQASNVTCACLSLGC